jgi:hypothetical protein
MHKRGVLYKDSRMLSWGTIAAQIPGALWLRKRLVNTTFCL